MPGTDLCIKIGGWVRAEAVWGGNGSMTWGPFNGNANNRVTSNETLRARGYITADVRNQTEYGTVRGYIAVGINTNDTGLQVGNLVDSANRAFVQWAGMTAGLSQSFFDFYSVPAMQYRGGFLPAPTPVTVAGGYGPIRHSSVVASPARFLRKRAVPRRSATNLVNSATCTILPGSFTGGAAGPCARTGQRRLRRHAVDRLRCQSARRPGVGRCPDHGCGTRGQRDLLQPGSRPRARHPAAGHPNDRWGWAAGFGLKINTPFISQGDWFQLGQRHAGCAPLPVQHPEHQLGQGERRKKHTAYSADCVYGGIDGPATIPNATSPALGHQRRLRALLDPAWHTSLYGAYYGDMARVKAGVTRFCARIGVRIVGLRRLLVRATPRPGCNNEVVDLGHRLPHEWDVTKTFYLGVEVLYQNMHSAQTPTALCRHSPAVVRNTVACDNEASKTTA